MNFYVFGGSGFVGTYLVNELISLGYEVHNCDLSIKEDKSSGLLFLHNVDIREKKTLELLKITSDSVIINLAANQYHHKVPKDAKKFFFDTNTNGMKNILDIGLSKGCKKVIMFSTDMTYGKPQYLPVDEKHPQHPFGYYGLSKYKAELICKEFRSKGMDITIFRPRMIVGKGRAGILYKLFKLIDLNLPVPMIGSGLNHYQMISVYDCVSAIICAINKNFPNEEFNLGSYNPPNVKTLLKELIRKANSYAILVPTLGGGLSYA